MSSGRSRSGPVLLAAALVLLLFFSYLTGIRAGFVLLYLISAVIVVAWVWPRLVARALVLERTFEDGEPIAGEPFREAFELRSTSWIPAPWVEVSDLGGLPGYQPGRAVSPTRSGSRWVARGVFKRRGWNQFGPSQLRVLEPFGLFERRLQVGRPRRFLVLPRVHQLPDLLSPSAQHAGDSPRGGLWTDLPPETSGVRDYVPGDPYNRIHWALTARHGYLMSKTFDQPLTADLWILLDLDRAGHVDAEEPDDSTVEVAISLAASIALQVDGRGRRVGLAVNDARTSWLEPHPLLRQDRAILEFLAVARADGTVPLARSRAWERVMRLPRTALAVITPSAHREWLAALPSMSGRNSACLLFAIDRASFAPGSSSGLPGPNLEPTSGIDLYSVRRGDDLSRLARSGIGLRQSA